MSNSSIWLKKIMQKDNFTFVIEWNDGEVSEHRLSELQKNCPCANCIDELTGRRLIDEKHVNPNVKAIRIINVGRYALRIQFTTGCSNGIYIFDTLRKMKNA